jgi:RecA-family ATPase
LACAVARGAQDWLGAVIEHSGPVVFFSAEETEGEIHRRLTQIADHHKFGSRDLLDLHVHCRPGEDSLFGVPDRNRLIQPTPLFTEFSRQCCDLKAALIIIETAADVYGGSEIDRAQVRQFMTLLRGLAIKSGATVLLLQHPSVAGMNSGSGTSGSTHWNNGARSRLYFTRVGDDDDEIAEDADARELIVKKSNYGPENERVRCAGRTASSSWTPS